MKERKKERKKGVLKKMEEGKWYEEPVCNEVQGKIKKQGGEVKKYVYM